MKSLNAEVAADKSVTIQKVLVAVDLSAHSEATATYAAEIGKCFNATLTLVYVYEPVSLYGLPSGYTYGLIENKREDLQQQLDQLTKKIRRLGGMCDSVILVGSPAKQIKALACDMDADLIVTASHHPTLLARLFSLDQAPRIVHRAPCPVLVYHEMNA
jgi:nucleotide-binding universal stress UspA family protein